MNQQQSFVTMHHKNIHFGEPCESGYSTTTSSEEGTLQRGVTHARKHGFASESFLQNPKLLKMVSKGINDEEGRSVRMTSKPHKKRAKNVYLDSADSQPSQGSPYWSTSSLTQQYSPQYEGEDVSMNGRRVKNPNKRSTMMSSDDAISRNNGNFADRSSTDKMTSSFEDLDVRDKQNYGVSNDDVIKSAANHQFQRSMNQVKSYQTDKFYPHFTKGKPQFDVDYYRVGDDLCNPYYDPLDNSDVTYGQPKKRVVISTSPSNSSSGGSPMKQPSPMRGILKYSNHGHPKNSTYSTPTRKNTLQTAQQFSKSEDNLTSIKNITPPNLLSSLSPGNRKSAFAVVKPRAVNRSAFPEGPVMPVHASSQQMIMQNGFESHQGHGCSSHSCCHGLNDQAIQFQVTPRNSTQAPRPTTLEYTPIADQLRSPQGEKPPMVNGSQLTPRDGNIVFIPAQIDKNGIARPVVNGFHDNAYIHDNGGRHHGNRDHQRENQKPRSVSHDKVRPQDDCNPHHSNGHHHSNVHSDSSHDDNLKSESPLPPAETLSNEAVRLRQLLENASAEELKQRLQKLLKSKDPGSIHAMTKLFPGSEFTADAAHCVRCHKDFNPRETGRCMLPHPERMVAKISQDSIGADFVCGCCNAAFRLIQMDFYEESTNALLTGHCYIGTHTTDPDSVDFRIDGGVAKSCEEFGCVEFYV